MDSNRVAYGLPSVVGDFAGRDALYPAELAALGEVWACARGDVLDVGVGGGRTTSYLRGPARSYRALDYQPQMVEACRRRFPGVAVEEGDARELRGHGDAAYDLVVFSFNGIDYVTPEERGRVLGEMRRVLRPGGAFVYSSHNLASLPGGVSRLAWPSVPPSSNPLRLGVRSTRAAVQLARRLWNRSRHVPAERAGDGWALVNDEAYDHALLTVYVDPDREVERLQEAGFAPGVLLIGTTGAPWSGGTDPWVHFVARVPGDPSAAAGGARGGR